jgi:plastocyanin
MRRAAVALAALPLAFVTAPATAGTAPGGLPDNVVLTIEDTYVPFNLTVKQGQTLDLVNLENSPHDFVAREWLDGRPYFQSDVVLAGGRTNVRRVETLLPSAYPFYCTVHDTMSGLLTVEPA